MLKTTINTVQKSYRKGFIFVAILFIVFSVFFNASIASADEADDVGDTVTSITGYDSSDNSIVGTFLWGSNNMARRMMSSGKSEADTLRDVAPVHSSLYGLAENAAKYYDLVHNNGGQIETDDAVVVSSAIGASEILKWSDGVNFNNNQANFNNYKSYLEAQNALFMELLRTNEKYPGSLPSSLTPEYMLKVIGSNYGVLQAIEQGKLNKDTDGDENGDGSGIEFDTNNDGVFDGDLNVGFRQLPSDVVRFVDQAQNIPEEVRESVKQASAIQCYRGGLEVDIVGCLAIGSYNILLKGSSLILALVGMVFNMSLNFTLNIGELFNDSSFGLGGSTGAIYIGWSTVRNFINVIFIFVLLYVAISTIIQNDKYGAKKMVTKIVIAALLINFSLFFSKAIIDLSNILALQFYARILESAKSVNGGASGADTIDGGLSSAMLNAIGLESMWTSQGKQYSPENNSAAQFGLSIGLDAYQLLALSIFGGGFILVFALVLFVAIAQFLMRTIVLLFLMITSPFGFIGEAIPALGGVASDWRKRLTNNAIFAPAYMAVLFVICQIMFGGARGDVVGGGNFANLLIGTEKERVGSIGIFFWFLLMMGLLLTGQGAARGFADKFGKGFVDKAEDAFKEKGKYGWRKGASWTGSKIGAGAKAAGRWGFSKTKDGLGAAANRLSGGAPGSRFGGQGIGHTVGSFVRGAKASVVNNLPLSEETRDKYHAAELERARTRADNLRRDDPTESDESFKARQANIIREAQERYMESHGLGHGDMEVLEVKDSSGSVLGYKYGEIKNKAKLTDLKNKAHATFGTNKRKRAVDSVKALESTFGAPKPGTSGYYEKELDKLKEEKKALEKAGGAYQTRLQSLKTIATQAEQRFNLNPTPANAQAATTANNKYDKHLEKLASKEKSIDTMTEKLSKAKEAEKAKREKDAEKNKKK